MRSTGIPNITEDELDEILFDYVRPACVKFKAAKQDLRKRNDVLAAFEVELTDEEIEILVGFMYMEYLSTNYINVPSLLRQSLVSRDYHAFSSANHLQGLLNLRDIAKKETRQMISVYSNTNSEVLDKLKKIHDERRKIETGEGSDFE